MTPLDKGEPLAVRALRALRAGGLGLALLAGCLEQDEPFHVDPGSPTATVDVSAEVLDAIPTVAVVDWAVTLERGDSNLSETRVEFGTGDELDRRAAGKEVGELTFRATLLGLPPLTEVRFRAVAEVDGRLAASDIRTLVTGAVPDTLPELEAQDSGPAGVERGFVVTSLADVPAAAMIADTEGNYVWWYAPEDEPRMMPRAHLSRDRESVYCLMWASGLEAPDEPTSAIVQVALDGAVLRTADLQGAHHDFVELPDGTLAVLVEDVRTVEDQEVVGDRLVELAPDGTVTEVWSVWDVDEFSHLPQMPNDHDWSHANSVDYDEDEDTFHITLLNFQSVYEIDRGSRELLWRFGGAKSDFVLPGDEPIELDSPHQMDLFDDRLLLFDNRFRAEESSRVQEFSLDPAGGEAELVWEHVHAPPATARYFGGVQRLPGGATQIDWSTESEIDQVGPDGELLLRLTAAANSFGYSTWLHDVLEPASGRGSGGATGP